ncbi:MAG: DUF1858 domain-containing protein [Rhodomicrobium sp.]
MWFRKKNPGAFSLSRVMDLSVDTVMRSWPGTTRAFLAFGMKCIGCPIGSFHSVEEACQEHGVDLGSFLAALSNAQAENPTAQQLHLDGDSASK